MKYSRGGQKQQTNIQANMIFLERFIVNKTLLPIKFSIQTFTLTSEFKLLMVYLALCSEGIEVVKSCVRLGSCMIVVLVRGD